MEWNDTALMSYGGGCGGGKMWSKADLWRKPKWENRGRRRTERKKKANMCGRSARVKGRHVFGVAVREDLVEKGDGIQSGNEWIEL